MVQAAELEPAGFEEFVEGWPVGVGVYAFDFVVGSRRDGFGHADGGWW